jgi:hypothetical protein
MYSINADVIHCIASLQNYKLVSGPFAIAIFVHINLPNDNMDQLLHMQYLQTYAFVLEFSEPCLNIVHLKPPAKLVIPPVNFPTQTISIS